MFTFLQNQNEFAIIKCAYEFNIQPQSKYKKQIKCTLSNYAHDKQKCVDMTATTDCF